MIQVIEMHRGLQLMRRQRSKIVKSETLLVSANFFIQFLELSNSINFINIIFEKKSFLKQVPKSCELLKSHFQIVHNFKSVEIVQHLYQNK